MLSRHLDHVGVMARSVEDAALLAETMAGFDEGDPDTRPIARPPLAATAVSQPPLPPRFAFVKTPVWKHADAVTQAAFAELVGVLREAAEEVPMGASFEAVIDLHKTVMETEMAHNFRRDYDQGRDKLSAPLRKLIERGRDYRAVDYADAVARIELLNAGLDTVFDEYDAILTPAAPGEAPRELDSTGNPIFCTIWTYLGTPAVTLPLLKSEVDMPIGVQLVGRRGNDARLLRTAHWLVQTLKGRSGRRGKNAGGRGAGSRRAAGRKSR
jgi:Asp-tRNA(Asn)/Glu-tRNA(Gln) amidotransferase A subunit family amidase